MYPGSSHPSLVQCWIQGLALLDSRFSSGVSSKFSSGVDSRVSLGVDSRFRSGVDSGFSSGVDQDLELEWILGLN